MNNTTRNQTHKGGKARSPKAPRAARRNGRTTHAAAVGLALERFSTAASRWAGRTSAFVLAVSVIVVWAVTGPVFGYSNTWQLVINTGTTIITFVMVFLIQRAQNKDAMAIQLKLNEIVAAVNGASNRLIAVEDLTEDELVGLHTFYGELARLAQQEHKLAASHSVEEARRRHELKVGSTIGG